MLDGWSKPEYLQSIVSHILQEAVKQGATAAEVDVGINKGFSVSVRKGDAESVEYHQDKVADITVYFGQRMGSASLSDLRPEAIHSALLAACNIARFTDKDEYSGLADKDLMAFDYPDLQLAHPWELSVDQAIEIAKQCEADAMAKDKRIMNAENAAVTTSTAWHAYGNTHDFIGIVPVTRHEISCVLVAKQGEEMQRDYSYTVNCDPALLNSAAFVAEDAVNRTIRRLGAKQLKTRKVPVIFAADQARGLLGHFVAAISGANLYRKSSFLLDHLDKPIFPAHISIDERPHLLKSLGSSPFDNDGVKTAPKFFIENGVLKSYALGTYSARKLGMKTTGNAGGVHNLFITTGNKDLSALLKTMDTGLLVTDLLGNGVNLVTGDYSRGVIGFWVEKGEIQYPVEEITIAGNLKEMYAKMVEVGCDVDSRGNIKTGSILLDTMTVAGH